MRPAVSMIACDCLRPSKIGIWSTTRTGDSHARPVVREPLNAKHSLSFTVSSLFVMWKAIFHLFVYLDTWSWVRSKPYWEYCYGCEENQDIYSIQPFSLMSLSHQPAKPSQVLLQHTFHSHLSCRLPLGRGRSAATAAHTTVSYDEDDGKYHHKNKDSP